MMQIIIEAKKGLEDSLRYNDSIKEQEKGLQHREESWK